MAETRTTNAPGTTRVVVLTADREFEQQARATFAAAPQIELSVISGMLSPNEYDIDDKATVVVIDLDVTNEQEFASLQRLTNRLNGLPPVVVVTPTFNQDSARRLLQMRVADLLVKPVPPVELVRTCARVVQTQSTEGQGEAEILTFMSSVGGAGVTSLAIETAMLLLEADRKSRASTCLVDLDFQHGSCADYLDLEPRLDLKEIEPRPERLDRQLLEVMTSYHPSGLAVIAAPNRPADLRSFDPDIVTRLLDLVASHFTHVVIDMPRTWFAWTDSVLLGSNRLFIVSEMTVPALKCARQMVSAIRERLGDGPSPQVIVNRFEQRLTGAGLRRGDIEQALGGDLIGTIPNDYRLVREAIDRGVPLREVNANNKVSSSLRRIIVPQEAASGARRGLVRHLSLSWAR
jgi:pilus assembly protein CpaE